MKIHRLTTSVLSAALLVGIPALAQAQQLPAGQIAIALPAMPLGDALRQLARLSGLNLAVDDQLIAGRMAPPLSGNFSPEDALRHLLAGSGLASRTEQGTIFISRFRDSVPASVEASKDDKGTEIVVTGTHLRGAPPTSPVIEITRKDIDQSGATSVQALMRQLPENFAGGVNEENFSESNSGQEITQYGDGINLRGLGQRATLVLINGRRVAPSDDGSFVDISMIPITAIERVEVVTDGASAIYGSDAVGGVVNFILRDDFKGIEPVVQVGTTTDGGGTQLLAGLTAGTNWSTGHAMLSYEYRDDQPIKASQRDFTIDFPSYWDITPVERRQSIYGTAGQELSDNLNLDLSGMYAVRHTDRDFTDAIGYSHYGRRSLDLLWWNSCASMETWRVMAGRSKRKLFPNEDGGT